MSLDYGLNQHWNIYCMCYLKLHVMDELADDRSLIALCHLLPPVRVVCW